MFTYVDCFIKSIQNEKNEHDSSYNEYLLFCPIYFLLMRPYFFSTVILLLTMQVTAQKTLPKFGEAVLTELQLKECSFEIDAPAMKLFDVLEVEMSVDYTVKIITERRVRIKIFNEKGFEHASIKIPYYNEKRSTKIKDFSAIIYNLDENGRITTEKVEKSDLYKDKLTKNLNYFTFTFPNLKKGSVIEFKYTKLERHLVQLDHWIIQHPIPTAYASYTLTFPERFGLKSKTFGSDSIKYTTKILEPKSYSPRERRFYTKENIISFKEEPFMSSINDNILSMKFVISPFKSFLTNNKIIAWNLLGSELLSSEFFGKQIVKTIPGTQSIIDTGNNLKTLPEKVEYVYNVVRKRIPDSEGESFFSDDVIDAWNNKTGTSGDANLILLNLLKKVGVIAYPVLVSTRENGLIDMDFPSLSQINAINILAMDSTQVFVLDASQKHSYKLPPLNTLYRYGYFLNPNDMKWVFLEDTRSLQTVKLKIVAELDAKGIAKGTATVNYYDFARDILKDTASNNENDKLFAGKHIGVKITTISNQEPKQIIDPLIQTVQFEYEPFNDEKFYYITPHFLGMQSKNPFTENKRRSDVDFGCNQKVELELQLKYPTSFVVEHLPQKVKMRSSDTTMVFARTNNYNENVIFYKQDFEIKRPFFFTDEYEGLQQFFTKMFAYLKEEIILKRVE